MSEKLYVKETSGLMTFLGAQLQGWARSKIKQRLQTGCVSVNGSSVTQHDFALYEGDLVEVGASAKMASSSPSQLDILYSDHDIIAINKPAGLLSVGTTRETQQHALAILRNQLSRRSQAVKLWPVNRIDRDTSGVLLFATSREIREAVMDKWDQAEKILLKERLINLCVLMKWNIVCMWVSIQTLNMRSPTSKPSAQIIHAHC
jgi:23S rRNA pseudouridine1911/1915/1917 synthase